MIVLDTNVSIAIMNGRTSPVAERAKRALLEETRLYVPSISLFELWYGIARSEHRAANVALLHKFLSGLIEVLNFEPADAQVAGELRQSLARVGRPIGPYDTLIAAQAIRHDALLVTANRSEFERVPGLRTIDWSAPDSERSTGPA